jgi:hypothetical protein
MLVPILKKRIEKTGSHFNQLIHKIKSELYWSLMLVPILKKRIKKTGSHFNQLSLKIHQQNKI